jgi:hypothetical protein
MLNNSSFFKSFLGVLILIFVSSFMSARAQDSEKYREDYARMQKIVENNQPAKRADQIIAFLKERPDLDAKIRDYVKGLFETDMRKMKVRDEFAALKELCDRAIKVDPFFGQAYLYYGYAMKNEKKDAEAINAFAKAYVVQSSVMQQAKVELDNSYRASHRGTLNGEENLISEVRKELNKLKK